MSSASVSKNDIELLENKIQVLEKQISKIKHKHEQVITDNSS
jgi:chaperonin cofactor prefoldin